MTTARAQKIDLASTPFYHCISRCVRRAYLYGKDSETGKDFSHRKHWIVARMKLLTQAFAINICAFAVMSNHYHLVLHADSDKAQSWDEEEIKERWRFLFPKDADEFDNLPLSAQSKKITLWQERLTSISWYMRCLNEHIAKLSNKEDDVTGRFWEGRFKSQALLDEGAVLGAMAYVDLNPIRANIAKTPETSEFTSIYERIKAFTKKTNSKQSNQPKDLMPFSFKKKDRNIPTIEFHLKDYLELVDTTGRILRENKKGKIPDSLPPLLSRLNLNSNTWLDMVKHLEHKFFHGIGEATALIEFTQKNKFCIPRGLTAAKQFYLTASAAA